jgi:asparagine synthase (glutamine-hydrolysing)
MCGIIGGNKFKNDTKIQQGLLSIIHRGKDDNTIFSFDNNMYLSHNRLSIQDLSEVANQPMVSDDSRYYLAFNGELWKSSFDKFDKKLRKLYNFKTEKSDTELLLYYLIHNIKNIGRSLRELDGMFAFSLYDSETKTTYLGRDFIGRMPLYYHYDGEKFGYCSEAKGLRVGLDTPYYKIDVKSKYHKMADVKDKETIYPVLPGHLITFEPHPFVTDSYEIKEEVWYTFKDEYDKDNQSYYTRDEEQFRHFEQEDKGVDYYVNGFKDIVNEAVDNELISDVPVCTILSGGIDSTIITYLLSKKLKNVEAFVVNVNPLRKSKYKDDLYYARMAAKEFGIKLHEVNVDREDIEKKLKESIWASETFKWTQVSPAVAQLFLAEEIEKQGYKVVFGGEGADEIFASYGDVKRFCWNEPVHWHQKRINLLNGLHKSNLVRTNKSMMYGGTVELRTPFLNKEVIDFGLRIPTKYRDENYEVRKNFEYKTTEHSDGNVMKFILRKAFENDISEELLWRPKKTFQVGCHTDYLKTEEPMMYKVFGELFVKGNGYTEYLSKSDKKINLEKK